MTFLYFCFGGLAFNGCCQPDKISSPFFVLLPFFEPQLAIGRHYKTFYARNFYCITSNVYEQGWSIPTWSLFQSSQPCPQILDMDGSDKHASLQWCGINYDRKNFYSPRPMNEIMSALKAKEKIFSRRRVHSGKRQRPLSAKKKFHFNPNFLILF